VSEAQLTALSDVSGLLEERGIDYWLFGGWAVDFYVGAVTRPHFDVDLAVWRADEQRLARLLEEDGWRHAPLPDEDGGTGYERGGVRLELTFLVREADGRVVLPLRAGPVPWPDRSLGDDVGELEGVPARLLALDALRAGKASPRDDPEDAAKDSADFRQLAARRAPGTP
jgi:hypothetical protein